MRGLLFKRAFDGVWKEFFDLWIAHGPKEVSISVMGDEPIVLTKEQLQGNFLLTCTGTIGSSDPAAEAQKAQNMVGLLAELAPILGDKYELDMGEVVLNWLEKADIRLMKRALRERSPEEIEELHRRREAAMAMQRSQELTLAQAGQKPQAAPAGGGPRKSGGLPPRLAMAAMGGSR